MELTNPTIHNFESSIEWLSSYLMILLKNAYITTKLRIGFRKSVFSLKKVVSNAYKIMAEREKKDAPYDASLEI